MEDKQQEAGWEITLPKFLFNPFVWIVAIGALVFGGYLLISRVPADKGDPVFQAMCEKDYGKSGWMKMVPTKDGKKISNNPCWGCMVDDNNMICGREQYEAFKKDAVAIQTAL